MDSTEPWLSEVPATARDDLILQALAIKVRLLALEQLAQAFWPNVKSPREAARRQLTKLSERGLVESHELLARVIPQVGEPTYSWAPGEPRPDLRHLVSLLQDSPSAPTATTIYVASKQTRKRFAGKLAYKLDRRHATHDLHLAAIYLHYLDRDPEAAQAWLGEDVRGKAGYRIIDPDAVLEFSDGRPAVAIEVATNYDLRRIQTYHENCERQGMAYQLWS